MYIFFNKYIKLIFTLYMGCIFRYVINYDGIKLVLVLVHTVIVTIKNLFPIAYFIIIKID